MSRRRALFLWLRSPFYVLFAARTAKLMTEDTEQKAVKRALKRDGVAKGMFFNLLGQIAIVASGGLVSILLARHFDAEIFGKWSLAISFGTFVGTIVEGGLNRVLVRDASRSPEAAGNSLGAVIKGRIGLSLITVPVSLIAAGLLYPDLSTWLLVLLTVLARCLQGLLGSYSSVLFAFEYFRAPNMVETWRRTALLVATVLIVVFDLSIHMAAVATLIFTVLGTSYLMGLTKRVVKVDYSASPKGYWVDAFWFWVNGVLFWINAEIAILMLSRMLGDEATGINAAAQRLAMLFLIIPRAAQNNVVPKLFRSAKDGRGLHAQLNVTTLLFTAVAGVTAVELWINADAITELVYSAKYAASAPALQVYGLFLLVNFMRTPASWYLSTSDRVKTVTVVFGLSGLLTIVGNLILIPRLGGVGAAWVCVFAEAFVLLLAGALTVRHTGPKMLIAYGLGSLPGLAALAIHLVTPKWVHWIVTAGVVTILFGLGLHAASKKLLRGWNPLGILSGDGPNGPVAGAPRALGGEPS